MSTSTSTSVEIQSNDHTVLFERALEVIGTLYALVYFISLFQSNGRNGTLPIATVVVAHVLVLAALALSLCRVFVRKNVDMNILKATFADPSVIVIICWMCIIIVVDCVVPRNAMAIPNVFFLFMIIMTVIFTDSVVYESRSFILFIAITSVVFLSFSTVLAILGIVEDEVFISFRVGQQSSNTDANLTDTNTTNNTAYHSTSTETGTVVTYTRTGVKRLVFIQLITFISPVVKKILCRSDRAMLTIIEKPVARWELMDQTNVARMSKKEIEAEQNELRSISSRLSVFSSVIGIDCTNSLPKNQIGWPSGGEVKTIENPLQ